MGERTILLVQPPGDPHGLLADEVGGGRVPWAYRSHVGGGRHRWEIAKPETPRRLRSLTSCALLLALDGVPVPMGCDRAVRVVNRCAKARFLCLFDAYTITNAAGIASAAERVLGARVVVLVDGEEVAGG